MQVGKFVAHGVGGARDEIEQRLAEQFLAVRLLAVMLADFMRLWGEQLRPLPTFVYFSQHTRWAVNRKDYPSHAAGAALLGRVVTAETLAWLGRQK